MRTHGWGGDPPTNDEEAITRILDSTRRCIDRRGPDANISDVARDLGITRQTVYRYFPSTDDLLAATAIQAAGDYLDRLALHVADLADPADAVVEGLAYTIESLPNEPYLNVLLVSGRVSAFTLGVTSETAMAFGRSIVERFNVDWTGLRVDTADLDELVEWMLRIFQSFVVDPGHPPRTGEELRTYLRRWIGSVVPHGSRLP